MKDFSRFLYVFVCVSFCAGCATGNIHDAAACGDLETLHALVKKDPDAIYLTDKLGKTPLHIAVGAKQRAVMEWLMETAQRRGNEAAHEYINQPDRTGMTPLHVAAMLGRKDEAQWLLSHGANIAAMDNFGDTPLHTAAVFGMGHLVPLLLEYGADLQAKNAAGKTPFELARQYRQEKLAAYLAQLVPAPSP